MQKKAPFFIVLREHKTLYRLLLTWSGAGGGGHRVHLARRVWDRMMGVSCIIVRRS